MCVCVCVEGSFFLCALPRSHQTASLHAKCNGSSSSPLGIQLVSCGEITTRPLPPPQSKPQKVKGLKLGDCRVKYKDPLDRISDKQFIITDRLGEGTTMRPLRMSAFLHTVSYIPHYSEGVSTSLGSFRRQSYQVHSKVLLRCPGVGGED